MRDSDRSKLLLDWGVEFSAFEGRQEIAGSPERTLSREVVRDTAGRRWILERIDPENLERKQQIAARLDALKASGLSRIHPYWKSRQKTWVSTYQNQSWMVRPFVEGIALNRDTYLSELWRAEAMAGFLIEMHPHARAITSPSTPSFSMPVYAEGRMEVWGKRYAGLAKKLTPSFQALQKSFFPVHDQLPTAFCHGDYHPLNMIWGEQGIESVIDWEFCGVKPELYDAALLIGCLGFDDPDALIHDLVIHIVQQLRSAELFSAQSWETIFELMATIRIGWMSEWIRRLDHEAIDMEVIYIDLLLSQKDYIQKRWA